MKNILDENIDILKQKLVEKGYKPFYASEVFLWIFKGASFSEMSNLPISLREFLQKEYIDTVTTIAKVEKSTDGAEKYLMQLADKNYIESVFLPNKYGNTLCVSTQVGCKMGCVFCASGHGGFVRNLLASEIVSQLIVARSKNPIKNIVFMGMGEPLDNYENTVKALKIFIERMQISSRNISVSTVGLIDKIDMLKGENFGITLSLSLHATQDATRRKLIPIAKNYTLAQTMESVKNYIAKTSRRVCIEYILIDGINDTDSDAKRLADLVKGYPLHINLISLNKTKGSKLSPSKRSKQFLEQLQAQKVSASLRRSYGFTIAAACGQLRVGISKKKSKIGEIRQKV